MVAATTRKVPQELEEVEGDERAEDVSRMIQETLSLEVGVRLDAWKPLPPCSSAHDSDDSADSDEKTCEAKTDTRREIKDKKSVMTNRENEAPTDEPRLKPPLSARSQRRIHATGESRRTRRGNCANKTSLRHPTTRRKVISPRRAGVTDATASVRRERNTDVVTPAPTHHLTKLVRRKARESDATRSNCVLRCWLTISTSLLQKKFIRMVTRGMSKPLISNRIA